MSLSEEGGEQTRSYSGEMPLSQLFRLLGLTSDSVHGAASRAGVEVKRGPPRYPGQQGQRMIAVRDFPKIIEGFQIAQRRKDGVHFHPWLLGIDSEAEEFEVTPPSGYRLLFSREKGEIIELLTT